MPGLGKRKQCKAKKLKRKIRDLSIIKRLTCVYESSDFEVYSKCVRYKRGN